MIYRHIAGVRVRAEFSPDRKYRYRLEVTKEGKEEGEGRTVCVIMLNPSYANEEIADRSVQFMEKVVFLKNYPDFKGVEKLIVVNLYACIQTKDFVPGQDKIGPANDKAIAEAILASHIVILAWGSAKSLTGRASFVQKLLRNHPEKILFRTRSHPSRGRYEGFLEPYVLL